MKVKELIEALKQYDENADVVVDGRYDGCGGTYTDYDVQPYWKYGEVVL